MKNFTFIFILFLSIKTIAQVGINTTSPNSQLDIRSTNQAAPSNTDGILIPKVDVFPATNPTATQQSMLVYLTTATVFSGNPKPIGFYYWDNVTTDWIGIASSTNGDHDWYEEGTTTPPNAITDDMYHSGNVAIGKNTADYPLDVNSSTARINFYNNSTYSGALPAQGIYNNMVLNSTSDKYGLFNSITSSSLGSMYGVYNLLSNNQNVALAGTDNQVYGDGTLAHIGTRNQLTGTSAGLRIGSGNYITVDGDGDKIGTVNVINGAGSVLANKIGTLNRLSGTSDSNQYGTSNEILNNGNGNQIATYNSLEGTGTGFKYGVSNNFITNTNGDKFGFNNNFFSNTNFSNLGLHNYFNSNSIANQYGTYNDFLSGAGNLYGKYDHFTANGNGDWYGNEVVFQGNGNGNWYGYDVNFEYFTITGTGDRYGFRSVIPPGTLGTNFYGLYSYTGNLTSGYAAYLSGRVSIGSDTTTGTHYILPLSRGTNGQIMQTDAVGNVTWQNPGTALNNVAWLTTGNTGINGGNTTTAGTNFIGTTNNQNLDIRTNNTYRARFSNLGEFFVGTLNTTITGDLANVVSNTTFPWAVNGYSNNNGSGVFGAITGGSTVFAAIQGENSSTAATGAGVRGLSITPIAGTGFGAPNTGVNGNATTSGAYKYGVYGSGGSSLRTGGVMGYDYGLAIGALGYYAANGNDYSVYGFGQAHQNGLITGRFSNAMNEKNTNIGLGIYGGVMGGWVRGMKYGFHTKGETYSLYVDGSSYVNKPLTYLIHSEDSQKVPAFMSTSMQPEITANGKTNLQNGKVFVSFDKNFSKLIADVEEMIITATPQGKSNGVYIDEVTKEGFWIIENNDGISNTKIAWIAITKIKGEENPKIPTDLLSNDFDKKMNNVMFNDNNTTDEPQSLWWDGTQIRWSKLSDTKVDTETKKLSRPR
ncbi:hypothetical protein [Flavobacterium sp.]|uniref:hypothetical protein n=1 Tax=Flavobacterium sp. TaxID=239 RepID=UPI0035281AD5